MNDFDLELHAKKFQKELASGLVSLALLAVVAKAKEPLYGYQIAKLLESDAGGVLVGKQSALYPVLRNLEGSGLLTSVIEPSQSGPPRRYYSITYGGLTALKAWTQTWTDTRNSIDALLESREQ